MIDIQPTTRIAWWNKDLCSLWEPRLERVRKAYEAAELSTVISGERRVFVYHVRSDTFDQSYEFLQKNHLSYFVTNRSGIYQGFSHKHQPVKPGEPYMLYGAAVRNDDLEAGELFTGASAGKTDHSMIGELLGYPKCCVDFFNETWSVESIDPIYEAALNTPEVKEEDGVLIVNCHPYCNNMLRYFGARITPHLTHSMRCEETIKWGKIWMDHIRQIDDEAADWVLELLSAPVSWNCLKGITIINTPWFRGVTNSDTTSEYKIVKNLGWVAAL